MLTLLTELFRATNYVNSYRNHSLQPITLALLTELLRATNSIAASQCETVECPLARCKIRICSSSELCVAPF